MNIAEHTCVYPKYWSVCCYSLHVNGVNGTANLLHIWLVSSRGFFQKHFSPTLLATLPKMLHTRSKTMEMTQS